MAPWSDVPTLIEFLDLGAEQSKELESALSQFSALSDNDQIEARAPVAEKIFPLIFGEIAVTASSPDYESQRQVPWSTNCWLSPKVIVTPSTSNEVAKVLAVCRFLKHKFSVRGGGHLQIPGFTSNEGGVVISLSKFSQVVVSEDKSTVDIGVGLRWLDVYKALDQHGLAVPGGRMPPVGVPGLLLGGGISFQNSEYGLGCMNIVNYEVVLADSSIVNVNATENSDLFWALKGGGPNFGVVTKIEMTTVPTQIWSEARLYPPTATGQLLEALMQYHEAIEKDNKATLIWMSTKEATLLVFFYCAPVESPATFQAFYDIPYITHVVPPSCRTVYGMVQAVANVLAVKQQHHEMRTMTSLPSLEVYQAADKARLEQEELLKDVEGLTIQMTIQPMSSNTIRAGDARGGNPLGLQAQGHQWFLILADWTNTEDETRVREGVRKIVDAAENAAKSNGTYLPFKYSNYSARDQNPLAGYGTENLQKLKSTALKYDPDGVFQTLQNGGWLLSKVAP